MQEHLIYVNGEFLPRSRASVSVFDHGLLYGDGVFEGIRAYSKRVFKLHEHVERLFESAKAIDLKIPHTKEEFAELILETCRRNSIVDGYIRPLVTRGVGDLGLNPLKCSKPTVVIIAIPFAPLYGDKYERGLKLVTATTRRNSPDAVSPNIKSLNYLNNILATIQSNQRGADEALFLDRNGYVSEASADNIFIVKRGALHTPYTVSNLIGVTRTTVLELAGELKIPATERFLTQFEVYAADEVFVCGTAAEIAPVVSVDDRVIGDGKPGPTTLKISRAYKELVSKTGVPIYK
ncbi:MAG: branched-chain-amino-acid transaminase [Thermoplasmatota archaeon]